MPTTYKILGQTNAATSGVQLSLYLVPAGVNTIVSSIIVCNRASQFANFYVQVVKAPSGTWADADTYIYYNTPLEISDTFIATIGLTLQPGDEVVVSGISAASLDLTFNLYGSELT